MKTEIMLLGSGEQVLVDAEDLRKIQGYNWHRSGGRRGQYVRARINGRNIYLHRLLMGEPKGFKVDHRNRDELDCRKENLRVVTSAQSMENIGLSRHNRSGYRGVCWHTAAKKWMVQVSRNNRPFYGGLFERLDEAAEAAKQLRLQLMTHSDGR